MTFRRRTLCLSGLLVVVLAHVCAETTAMVGSNMEEESGTLSSSATTNSLVGLSLTGDQEPSLHRTSSPLASHATRLAKALHQHHRKLVETQPEIIDSASLQSVCQAMENHFVENVLCVCTGANTRTFSIACHFPQSVCTESDGNEVCGRPYVALSMVESRLFSTSACVYDYKRHDSLVLSDTCISLEVCKDEGVDGDGNTQFCTCSAQHGGRPCKECSICGNGGDAGIFMDCSNVNAEVVTQQCDAVDMDMDLSDGAEQSSVVSFVPSLNGLCSQLEAGLDNRVECDCSDTGGGNFSVWCHTAEGAEECINGLCGKVHTTVTFQNGDMYSIDTCTDFEKPNDLEEACVSFILDDERSNVEQCSATYGKTDCTSCSVCIDDEGKPGVLLDCSNVEEWAVVKSCQSTQGLSRQLEFVPDFQDAPRVAQTQETSSAAPSLYSSSLMALSLVLGEAVHAIL